MAMYDTLASYSDTVVSHEVFTVKEVIDKFGHREVIPSPENHGKSQHSLSFGGKLKPKAVNYYDMLVNNIDSDNFISRIQEWVNENINKRT